MIVKIAEILKVAQLWEYSINLEDYLNWLEENNLNDNDSNLREYCAEYCDYANLVNSDDLEFIDSSVINTEELKELRNEK